MRMGSPGHQFSGALADALGALALREGAVIEEEAEQVQITLAQLPAEEEVISEAAVEVLDEGTATRGSLQGRGDGYQHPVEAAAEQAIQEVTALPIGR